MIIESGSLRLRPLTIADVDEWLAGEVDEAVRWFGFVRPSDPKDFAAAIDEWSKSWRDNGPIRQWGIVDIASSRIAGGVELRGTTGDELNLSYVVFQEWRGRGMATRAANLAVDYAASSMPSYSTITMAIHEGNLPSIAVANRLGAMPYVKKRDQHGNPMIGFRLPLEPRRGPEAV